MSQADHWTIHTDGAARGNPGPAAFSYVIHRDGEAPVEVSGCLGNTTNNIAEYTALVKALERAQHLGGRRLLVHSDSELMIKQMNGEYKVKHEGLRPLYEDAQELCTAFDHVTFRHVRREQNKRADELCNLALDGDKASRPPKESHEPRHQPKKAVSDERVREEALDCLRSVAVAWSRGNPNDPRVDDVWDQLWTILEEGGVLKAKARSH